MRRNGTKDATVKCCEKDLQVTKQLGCEDIRRDDPPGELVHLVIGVGPSWSVFRVPLVC